MDRMRRVLSAIKMNEMVQLGAQMRQVEEARQEAIKLRGAARNLSAAETATEMMQQGQWRDFLERGARAAEDRANTALADAAPLKARLARTLGREDVTLKMIAAAKRDAMRIKEARAEDETPRRPDAASSGL